MTGGGVTSAAPAAARGSTAALHDFVARRAFAPSPRSAERLGAEIEFVAVCEGTGQVAPLESPDGPSVLDALRLAGYRHGWAEGHSGKGAPWFCLPSGGRVTFEPGGQVEYASPPLATATELLDDLRVTTSILREACGEGGVRLLDCGIDPTNGPERAPLQVHAPRYRRMDAYFARLGPAGARMMRQTASLHVCVDIGDDGFRRWRLLNGLAPVLTAMFANSRCYAGEDTGFASYRAETWRRTDASRTGLLPGRDPVAEYVDFAMRAPAFLLGGDDEPARPFGAWLGEGVATAHWEDHLGTLFPDVRPRGYFEVRSVDAVPETHWPAAVAFIAGLTHDPVAACHAVEIVREPDPDLLERAGRTGLGDRTLAYMARELTAAALAGCVRLGPAFLADRHLGEATDVLRALTE